MKLKYKRCVAALAFFSMTSGACASIKLTCRHGKYLASRHFEQKLLAQDSCDQNRINCKAFGQNTHETCKLLMGYGKLATLH